MKESLIEILASPVTGECLKLEDAVVENGEITFGNLVSQSGEKFPVIGGIPRFVSSEAYSKSFGLQWNLFRKTQLDSANGTRQSENTFIEKTGWLPEKFEGDTILEAGCGMGRFVEIVSKTAKMAVGMDLSSAVEAAYDNLKHRKNVHIVQADIFKPPFRERVFSKIYSIGVLHHTPDPEKAFNSLCPLLCDGGLISLWLYSKKIRNPVALFTSDLYRKITTRIPSHILIKLSWLAVPLGKIYKIPLLGKLFNTILPISPHQDPEWRWLDTFDWYSPEFQFRHTFEELKNWFEKAGLSEISELDAPVSITGKRQL